MALVSPSTRITGDLITAAIWNQDVVDNVIALLPSDLQFLIDGGDAVPATGLATGCLRVPWACTITAARLYADVNGAITVDIWSDTHANYPPTVADTIVQTGTKPVLSTSDTYEDGTLTDWDTSLAAGEILYYNVETSPAPATLTWVLVSLAVQKT